MNKNVRHEGSSDHRNFLKAKPFRNPVVTFFHGPGGLTTLCVFLFAFTACAFAPLLKAEFQFFDESSELLNNPHMMHGLDWSSLGWAFSSLEYSNWYPMTWMSHMLDAAIFGFQPWGHHLTNVLIHAANAVLLFLVLKQLTNATWRSLIVAALFALHPLRVESVAWISERKDVLSGFFGLLALWAYARFAQESKKTGGRSRPYYLLALLFFALALMSKSMVITLPFVMLLLDFWPLERWRSKELWSLVLEKVPFLVMALPVSLANFTAQNAGGQFMLNFPYGFRLETALMGCARYLEKMFWPANYSVLYPYPDSWPAGELLLAGALVVGISTLALVYRRQRPYLPVGWLWYVGMLIPVSGLIPLGAQSMSNRYTYLPMIGVLFLLVWSVGDLTKHWPRKTVVLSSATILLLTFCFFKTRVEIGYWNDGPILWSRAVATTTNNFMAHYCLGVVLPDSEQSRKEAEFQKSVDIYPDYWLSQFALAQTLLRNGHFADAVVHYRKADQMEPESGLIYYGMSLATYRMRQAGEAVSTSLKAVELDPQNERYKGLLFEILFQNGTHANTISNCLAILNEDASGFEMLWKGLRFDTNNVSLINNLAFCFATNPNPKLRNGNYAVRLATRACEMTGYKMDNRVAVLAAADAEASRFDEAVTNAQLACSLASAAGHDEQLKECRVMLDLFSSHRPYRIPLN